MVLVAVSLLSLCAPPSGWARLVDEAGHPAPVPELMAAIRAAARERDPVARELAIRKQLGRFAQGDVEPRLMPPSTPGGDRLPDASRRLLELAAREMNTPELFRTIHHLLHEHEDLGDRCAKAAARAEAQVRRLAAKKRREGAWVALSDGAVVCGEIDLAAIARTDRTEASLRQGLLGWSALQRTCYGVEVVVAKLEDWAEAARATAIDRRCRPSGPEARFEGVEASPPMALAWAYLLEWRLSRRGKLVRAHQSLLDWARATTAGPAPGRP